MKTCKGACTHEWVLEVEAIKGILRAKKGEEDESDNEGNEEFRKQRRIITKENIVLTFIKIF